MTTTLLDSEHLSGWTSASMESRHEPPKLLPQDSFPYKLHSMLDDVETHGLSHIVSWQPHGRCFVVHRRNEFVQHLMPIYFRMSKFSSFQRQLNLYNFNRITTGRDKKGYYHELFLRGRRDLCKNIQRQQVKGTGVRQPSAPERDPNFYLMEFVPPASSSTLSHRGGQSCAKIQDPVQATTATSSTSLSGMMIPFALPSLQASAQPPPAASINNCQFPSLNNFNNSTNFDSELASVALPSAPSPFIAQLQQQQEHQFHQQVQQIHLQHHRHQPPSSSTTTTTTTSSLQNMPPTQQHYLHALLTRMSAANQNMLLGQLADPNPATMWARCGTTPLGAQHELTQRPLAAPLNMPMLCDQSAVHRGGAEGGSGTANSKLISNVEASELSLGGYKDDGLLLGEVGANQITQSLQLVENADNNDSILDSHLQHRMLDHQESDETFEAILRGLDDSGVGSYK